MTDNLRTQTDIHPGTYLVDPDRSAVSFTATHVFGLKPVDGTMTVRSGTVMVAGEPHRSTVSAELDAGSFTTDDERRNKDVRGRRFLDAANHPTIGFRSTRIAFGDDGPQIIGVLSVRGGSAEVTLAVTEMAPTVDGYRFTAATTVDRLAAGVTAGRAIIGRYVSVTLTLYVTAD
ncbi:MAG TPA: YceI family protein [Micromonosporaceae bacterium]|jgi:polyisoprenoid-binding protein YceI